MNYAGPAPLQHHDDRRLENRALFVSMAAIGRQTIFKYNNKLL